MPFESGLKVILTDRWEAEMKDQPVRDRKRVGIWEVTVKTNGYLRGVMEN